MNWVEYDGIWIDPDRMHGAPCLKGTRVTPETILVNYDGAIEDGLDGEEAALLVHSYFPTVTVEQIHQLIAYVDKEEVEAHA